MSVDEPEDDCLAMGHRGEEKVGEKDGEVWWRCRHCGAEWETDA